MSAGDGGQLVRMVVVAVAPARRAGAMSRTVAAWVAYARAALDSFQRAEPGAASDAADAERLITGLEQRNR
jgi:hypothetical protein